ncbi:MAG: N-acetylmuramoyl-L-alanine amidase [Candidatus Babeliales bacterium]
MSIMLSSTLVAKQTMNELTKVFYHRVSDTQPHIDLGKIVLYFTHDPIINRLPRAHDDTHTMTFFFPVTKASDQARTTIEGINSHTSAFYRIQFEFVSKPIPGIKCTVVFDPERVDFSYATFDSIGLQKGLVFRFYNKGVIEQLNKKHTSILRTASACKQGIVIDCGHGGSDDGTVGFFNIKEKDITRSVGLKVAQLLEHEGFSVFLTRTADESVELDERTTFANTCNQALLMVSIHANSAPNSNSRGIETFCLADNLFKSYTARDTRLAQMHTYVHELNEQSALLAHTVHDTVLASVKKKQNNVVDRKVKYSVSQVLIGSILPSALIEIGFLSNKEEAQLLRDHTYQQLLAQGICNGICAYVQQQAM